MRKRESRPSWKWIADTARRRGGVRSIGRAYGKAVRSVVVVFAVLVSVVAVVVSGSSAQAAPTVDWTRQFGVPGDDQPHSVAVAGDGSVYVSGETRGALDGVNAGSIDAYVRKYDAAGAMQWTRQFGSAGEDYAPSVAVAADGSVYVAGGTNGALSVVPFDAYVRKYDPAGALQWTRQFGTVDSDYAESVAVAADGSVYVAGQTKGALDGVNAGLDDAFVRKFDAAGAVVWTRQFGTPGDDRTDSVAVAGDGSVYVAGDTTGVLDGVNAGDWDAYVRKFDAAGAVQWTRQFGTAGSDHAFSVAAAADGSVYVAGQTGGVLDGVHAGSLDAFVRKYDAAGAVQWTRQFGTVGYDWAEAAAVAGDGSVYVAGTTDGALDGVNAGGFDAFIRKYAAPLPPTSTTSTTSTPKPPKPPKPPA